MHRLLVSYLNILFITFSNGSFCQTNDTLMLASGDIVVGEFLSLDKGDLSFDTEEVGTLKVEPQYIVWIKTSKKVSITTVDSEIVVGTYIIKNQRMEFYSDDGDTLFFQKDQIAEMHPVGQGFWQSVRGSIGAGFNYTGANNFKQGNATVNMNYLTQQHYYSVTSTYIGSQAPDDPAEENLNVSISADRLFQKYFFIGAEYAPQRNTALKLQWRNTLGMYFGKKQMLSPYSFISGSLGLSWNNEFFKANAENQLPDQANSAEVNATVRMIFKRADKPKLRSEILADYYRAIGAARNRFNLNATGSVRIISELWLSITFFLNTDDKPQGIDGEDFGFISNISYAF